MLKWISNIFSSKQKEDNTDCMNKFLIVGLGNIGAEYVHRHNIGLKYWIILPKRTTFISNRQTGCPCRIQI
jgi:PTH1 family peptidyl-tRNA hydrolase